MQVPGPQVAEFLRLRSDQRDKSASRCARARRPPAATRAGDRDGMAPPGAPPVTGYPPADGATGDGSPGAAAPLERSCRAKRRSSPAAAHPARSAPAPGRHRAQESSYANQEPQAGTTPEQGPPAPLRYRPEPLPTPAGPNRNPTRHETGPATAPHNASKAPAPQQPPILDCPPPGMSRRIGPGSDSPQMRRASSAISARPIASTPGLTG